MRRVALLSVIISLVISLAAPTGAVFASEGIVSEPPALLNTELDKDSDTSTETTENEVVILGKEAVSLPPSQPVVAEPTEILPASPLLITAYKASGAHVHAIQVYNNSSDMVPLEGVTLLYVAGDSEYEIPLPSGWIEPRSYIVMAWQGESQYADIEFQFDQVGDGVLESIELYHSGYQPLAVSVPAEYSGELLHRYKSSAGNYTTNTNFAPGEATISGGGLYVLPGVPELSVREILVNPRDCTFGFETPDCYDYIKLRNNSVEPLDLSLYRLRSGYSNTNSTTTNTTYFNNVLAPGEVITLMHGSDGERVSFAANDGTVWLEDRYGFKAYDLGVPPYVDSGLAAHAGRSWAYNDKTGLWQWATPAPETEENNFSAPEEAGQGAAGDDAGLKPCGPDQYRSEETNRCRKIASSGVLKPCKEGQYRSEETNRCRSIATAAASILKPCADDQFRNPATNRCKKIASAEDMALADCGEGRERNPLTNRCRNVLGASTLEDTLPFPVEETSEGTESFAGWWTIGIITALGLGYGIWEWRVELLGAASKARQFVTRAK